MTTMASPPSSFSSSSSSSAHREDKGTKIVPKMDPQVLRDDFQLYVRVGLLLAISVYTAIKVNAIVSDPYLVCITTY